MNLQFLELVFFAVLAFTLINKLISILGATNDGDEEKYKSFYGEKSVNNIKNNAAKQSENIKDAIWRDKKEDIKAYIKTENIDNVLANINDLQNKLPNFEVDKFINSSKVAFKLIINSFKDPEKLEALIDKRYLEKFVELKDTYKDVNLDSSIDARITEIYNFGNNFFIKILFKSQTTNNGELAEEWTFTKSLLVNTPNWYLTNVEKADA